MEWFKLDVARVRSVERLRLPASVEGTHVRLLAYASSQEGGGVVVGAARFGDRDWLIAAGVTSGEVESLVAAGLARMDGDDLHLVEYDRGAEDGIRAKREGGRAGRRRQLAAAASGTLPFMKESKTLRDSPGDTRGESPGRLDKIRSEKIREERSVAGAPPSTDPKLESAAPNLQDATDLATYLLEAIRSHTPDHAIRESAQVKWARDIDLALRVDKRTPDQLRAAIDFAHRSGDTFWRPNILSGKKLREKYDQLAMQARRQPAQRPSAGPTARELAQRAMDEMARERGGA